MCGAALRRRLVFKTFLNLALLSFIHFFCAMSIVHCDSWDDENDDVVVDDNDCVDSM